MTTSKRRANVSCLPYCKNFFAVISLNNHFKFLDYSMPLYNTMITHTHFCLVSLRLWLKTRSFKLESNHRILLHQVWKKSLLCSLINYRCSSCDFMKLLLKKCFVTFVSRWYIFQQGAGSRRKWLFKLTLLHLVPFFSGRREKGGRGGRERERERERERDRQDSRQVDRQRQREGWLQRCGGLVGSNWSKCKRVNDTLFIDSNRFSKNDRL